MFYIAKVITFSTFLELLWISTLLIRHKLNIFWPPHVNQFDTHALFFGSCARFIPLGKMVYRNGGNSRPLAVHQYLS